MTGGNSETHPVGGGMFKGSFPSSDQSNQADRSNYVGFDKRSIPIVEDGGLAGGTVSINRFGQGNMKPSDLGNDHSGVRFVGGDSWIMNPKPHLWGERGKELFGESFQGWKKNVTSG
jgi:hypothetical protein